MSSYSSTVLTDNPIRYYRLGEPSGTVATDSGSQRQNGTLSGSITLAQAGLLVGDANTAMLFDGSTGSISLPTTGLPTAAHPWSMDAWVKMPATLPTAGASRTVVGFGSFAANQNAQIQFSFTGKSFLLTVYGADIYAATNTVVGGGTYHVAATYDGTTLSFFVNGSVIGTSTPTLAMTPTFASIGVGDNYFSGTEQDVAFYSYALTPSQVATHYRVGAGKSITVPTDGHGVYESINPGDPTAFARLEKIAAAGFTLVLNYNLLNGTLTQVTDYIAHAAAVGLKVIAAVHDPRIWNTRTHPTYTDLAAGYPDLYAAAGSPTTNWGSTFTTYVVNQLKALPGVWGWYVGDETIPTDHTLQKAQSDTVLATDATHPRLFIAAGGNNSGDNFGLGSTVFSDCCDVGGDDYYPIGNSDWYDHSIGQEAAGIQTFCTSHSLGSAIVLQAFSWSHAGNPSPPWPTRVQMRAFRDDALTNMTPRVVLWYNFWDVTTVPPAPASQWSDLTWAATGVPHVRPMFVPRAFGATLINRLFVPRAFGATLVIATNVPLSSVCAGSGILSGTLLASETLTGATLAGNGTLAPTLAATMPLACTLSGNGVLTGTATLFTALASVLAGAGTLAGMISASATLSGTMSGTGQLSVALACAIQIVGNLAGNGQLVGALSGGVTTLSLYGSNVAAGGVTTAGECATTTGGVEVAAVTTAPASGSGYVECFALGGTSTVNASLPAPSGKGWLLDLLLLEGQRLVTGPWTASVAVSDANGGGPVNSYTLRFWQHSSGGTYAAIGSLVLSASQVISTLRVVKAFVAAAMPQTDFAVGDKLYIDFFINANGWASDALSVYVSNSGSAGVIGDLEVDTAGYTPSGSAGVVTSYIPRALSALLVVTSTALLDTLSGTGQFTGAISTLSTALSLTFSGGGVLSGQVAANLALPTTTLAAGVSSLSGLPSLATSLATSQFTGSSTLAASVLARTVLTGQFAGIDTLASSFQLATSLVGQFAGVSTLSATMTANLALPGIVLPGVGTLTGTLSTSTLTPVALVATMVSGGTLTGAGQLATSLVGQFAGVSTLSATMTASTTLASTTLAGSGVLIGATARGTVLSTTTLIGAGTLGASLSAALTLSGTNWVGVGTFSGTLTGAGGLVGTLSGGGTLAGSLSAALTLIGANLAGVGVLSATVQASTVLGTTLSGGSTLAGTPGTRTALGATLVGIGTLAGAAALTTALAGVVSSVGTLAGAAGRNTALSVALPGNGQLIAVASAQTSLTSSFSGVGTAAFTLFLRTSFTITLSGAGDMTSASISPRAALALLLAGIASLSGSLTIPVLAYLTATWKTRDGQVVWVTRDEQEATWVTRDGQITWKIRS